MAVAVDAIGVISGVLGIFQFLQGALPSSTEYDNKFRLSIANDGTSGSKGPGNAGGTPPDVRIWGPTAESLGITVNDDSHCGEGDIVCDFQVDNVKQAPDYALFTANDDAICMTSMRTTYPDDTKYSVVIGNYAEACSNNFGVSAATWYYTSDNFKGKNGESINVKCSWIDANGDQPCTGIQVHWPDYNGNTEPYQSEGVGHFCKNHPTLFFHTNKNPHTVTYYTNTKRDESSIATSPSSEPYVSLNRTGSSHQFSHRLVKSSLEGQSASYICTAKGAAGPSFVSYEERKFCHMPTKSLFPFCEDVATGACYDDDLELVIPKISTVIEIPAMNFTNVAKWTEFRDVL